MNLGKLECLSKSRNCPTTRPLTFVNKGRKKRKKKKNNRGEEKLWKLSTPRNDGIIQKEFSSRIERFIKQGGLFPRTNLEPTKGPPFDDRSTLIDRLAVRSIDDARIDLEVTAEGDQRTERYPSSSPPPAKHRWMVYGCGFVEGDHRPRIIHSAVFRCARARVCACLPIERTSWLKGRHYWTGRCSALDVPSSVIDGEKIHGVMERPCLVFFSREIICDDSIARDLETWFANDISVSSWVNWYGKGFFNVQKDESICRS